MRQVFRAPLQVGLVLLLTLLPLGVLAYDTAEDFHRDRVEATLDAIAEAQAARLNTWLLEEIGRVPIVANGNGFVTALSNYNRTRAEPDLAVLTAHLNSFKSSMGSLESVGVLDFQGRTATSTDRARTVPLEGEAYQRGRTQASAFLTRPAGSPLQLVAVGPVSQAGRLLGVLVLESRATELEAVAADHTGLGKTGETYVGTLAGDGAVRILSPLRGDANAGLARTEGSEGEPSPLGAALEGHEGFLAQAVDYRGKAVVASTRQTPATGWGLATKMDRSEAYAPVAGLHTRLVWTGLLLGLLALGGGGAYGWWADQRGIRPSRPPPPPLERPPPFVIEVPAPSSPEPELRALEERAAALESSVGRLEAALQAIPEGVISMDERGRITLFNPAAERLFEIKAADLRGQPLTRLLESSSKKAFLDGFEHFRSTSHPDAVWHTVDLVGRRLDGKRIRLEFTLAGPGSGPDGSYTAVLRRGHDSVVAPSVPETKRLKPPVKPARASLRPKATLLPPLAAVAPSPVPAPPPTIVQRAPPAAPTLRPSRPLKIPAHRGGPLSPTALTRLRRSLGNGGAYAERLDEYVEESGQFMAEIRGAVAADDARALVRAAAGLRTSSAAVGVAYLSKLSGILEQRAKSGDLHDLTKLLQAMEVAHRKSKPALRLEQRRIH